MTPSDRLTIRVSNLSIVRGSSGCRREHSGSESAHTQRQTDRVRITHDDTMHVMMLRVARGSSPLARGLPLARGMCDPVKPSSSIKLSTSEVCPGWEVRQHFGIVTGSTVRTKDVTKDIMASVRQIFGGEITTYTELLDEARAEALLRLRQAAVVEGANGVVAVRISTTTLQGMLQADRLQAGRLEAGRLQAGRLKAGRLQAGRLEAGRLEAGRLEPNRLETHRHITPKRGTPRHITRRHAAACHATPRHHHNKQQEHGHISA